VLFFIETGPEQQASDKNAAASPKLRSGHKKGLAQTNPFCLNSEFAGAVNVHQPARPMYRLGAAAHRPGRGWQLADQPLAYPSDRPSLLAVMACDHS